MTNRTARRRACPALLLIASTLLTNGLAASESSLTSLDTRPRAGVSQEGPVLTRGPDARLSQEVALTATEKLLERIRTSSKRQAAEAAYHLGRIAMERRDVASAEAFNREAMQLDPDNLTYLKAAVSIAYLSGEFDEALEYLTKVLAILQDKLGEDHVQIANVLDRLGAIYVALHRYEDAESHLKQSLAIREQRLGKNHPAVAVSLNLMASVAMNRNRPGEAEVLLQRSLQVTKAGSGPKSPDAAAAIHSLAEFYRRQERFTEAKALYEQAVAIWGDSTKEDSLKLAATRYALGKLYLAQKQLREARTQFELTLPILKNALGPEHPYVSAVLRRMSGLDDQQETLAATGDLYQALVAAFEARSSAE